MTIDTFSIHSIVLISGLVANCFLQMTDDLRAWHSWIIKRLKRNWKIANEFFLALFLSLQARRHGGAFRGRAPTNDCLCLPKRGLCFEEINRLGATGVQIEA